MKKHFVIYGNFSNVYDLLWTDSLEMEKELPEGAKRITRTRALELARAESERAKYTPSSSGYASSTIAPAGYKGNNADGCYKLVGQIWERES